MTMGCCFSRDDEDTRILEPTERTWLMSDAQANEADGRPTVPQTQSTRPSGNETLAQILDRSANAYIDVNAVDCSRLQSHSYSSKYNQYSERVNSSMSVQSLVRNPRLLPFGVISHTAVLNEPILSKADLETIIATSDALDEKLGNMRPSVKEPLATYMP